MKSWKMGMGVVGLMASILAASRATAQVCVGIAVTPSLASPQALGTVVTFAASSNGDAESDGGSTCFSPQYAFYAELPDGSWTTLQGYSSTSSYAWTGGPVVGSYNIEVWVKDANSTKEYDTYTDFTYTLTTGGAPSVCTSVTVTPSPGSPQSVGTSVLLTASSTSCPNPNYAFYDHLPDGTWSTLRAYSTNPSYTWTSGPESGTYDIEVWAVDASSTKQFDTYTDVSYTLTAGTPPPTVCTSVSLLPSPAGPQVLGTTVALNATSSSCPNPNYAFFAHLPDGTWSTLQSYSTNASYSWTSGPEDGVYDIEVWVVDASSSKEFDTYTDVSYTLTGGAPPLATCTSVTLTPSPASPQAVGEPVTLNASSTGCSNPLYEFYDEQPDGTWTLLQSYSDAGYTWTSGPLSGIYDLEVWAKEAGSANAYDTYTDVSYTLSDGGAIPTPCTSVTAAFSPVSPQSVGTQVMIAPASTSCPDPLYAFYDKQPDGTWVLLQAYSDAGYTWPSGPEIGTYDIEVWAKDQSSSAEFDTYTDLPYVLNN
jgi:hypothetical protein